jgi:hypothetical protein
LPTPGIPFGFNDLAVHGKGAVGVRQHAGSPAGPPVEPQALVLQGFARLARRLQQGATTASRTDNDMNTPTTRPFDELPAEDPQAAFHAWLRRALTQLFYQGPEK